MPPLPLPLTFTEKGFAYEQLERQGDIAIYSQTHPGGAVRYEVIRVRIQREHVWPTGVVTPEKEAYPGSTSWGRLGASCFTLLEAQVLAATWQQERNTAPLPEEPEEEPGDTTTLS